MTTHITVVTKSTLRCDLSADSSTVRRRTNCFHVVRFLTTLVTCRSLQHAHCEHHRSERITPLPRDLHRLRVPEQIRFRLCVLMFRCLNGTAPSYLADSICRVADVEGRRHLRSSATATLIVPPVRRSTLGDRSFSVAAPRAWNSLPSAVRAASSLTTFWRELKTFLVHSRFLDH